MCLKTTSYYTSNLNNTCFTRPIVSVESLLTMHTSRAHNYCTVVSPVATIAYLFSYTTLKHVCMLHQVSSTASNPVPSRRVIHSSNIQSLIVCSRGADPVYSDA